MQKTKRTVLQLDDNLQDYLRKAGKQLNRSITGQIMTILQEWADRDQKLELKDPTCS